VFLSVCPVGGRRATRQLAGRHIDRVFDQVIGAGNTGVHPKPQLATATYAPSRSKIGPPESPSQISLLSPGAPAQSMTESTVTPSFRSFHISQSEALRVSTDTDHRQDIIIHGIAPYSVYQTRRQVPVAGSILQLQKHAVVATVCRSKNGACSSICRYQVQTDVRRVN
jgi:hypothetical protein